MDLWVIEELSFSFSSEPAVLSRVSLRIPQGQTVGLVGPNGSGKTTLGKLMMGILKPTEGRVLLEGQEVASMSLDWIGARVGYVFQNPERQFFASTVAGEVEFGLRFRGLSPEEVSRRGADMLDYFDLGHRKDSFPFNLSQGEKQRLALASILVLEPSFIIMDEPTTGMDPRRRERFCSLLDRVKERGVGYLLITHDKGLVERSTERLLVMREGAVHDRQPSAAG